MSHRYSFNNYHKFVAENQGVEKTCNARVADKLDCKGCKFEKACYDFLRKEFPNVHLHDR